MFGIIYKKAYFFTVRCRTIFWRRLFGKFGPRSKVFGRIAVSNPRLIEIGDHSTLNEGVVLNARERITIGNYVHISTRCVINTVGLDYRQILESRGHFSRPVIVEDGVWLGAGAIINPGVKIGKNSVIGAGAVVTKDIPTDSVAVGVPARVVKRISE